MIHFRSLGTDIADLVLARSCAGCEAPGSVLCGACWSHLTRRLVERDLPEGFTAVAATEYLGIGASIVIAHKEHGWNALTPMLGALLARAVTSVTSEPVTLVPIPPHAHSRARRGTDPLADIVAAAERALHGIGQHAEKSSMLVRARDAGSLKLLSRDMRQQAVQSSFSVDTRKARSSGALVIVDDVITTGVTVAEAQRTLESHDLAVTGIAAVASTPLRGSLR
ncbi:MAG: hypothetical protein RL205_922 [Actinomycetota bacterium]|jgi:predicted amidophosphoribosyltransferase